MAADNFWNNREQAQKLIEEGGSLRRKVDPLLQLEKQIEDRRKAIEAAQAKLFATETAKFCVDRAMQIHGGYGYIGEFSPIEKLYRDQRIMEIVRNGQLRR